MWFAEAQELEQPLPEGMILATVGADGRPSQRTVLLKQFDQRGFSFFTNYHSRKARELETNSQAALLFWWRNLQRQVRIEGPVTLVDPVESDEYFATRPRGSQLSAWASAQSEVIASREVLTRRMEELEKEYEGQPVPRPPHWGGYCLTPDRIEFWQGQLDRLHDRFLYRRETGGWKVERLAP